MNRDHCSPKFDSPVATIAQEQLAAIFSSTRCRLKTFSISSAKETSVKAYRSECWSAGFSRLFLKRVRGRLKPGLQRGRDLRLEYLRLDACSVGLRRSEIDGYFEMALRHFGPWVLFDWQAGLNLF